MGSDSVSIHQYDANFARVGQQCKRRVGYFARGVWRIGIHQGARGVVVIYEVDSESFAAKTRPKRLSMSMSPNNSAILSLFDFMTKL
jgi:hypothetical protein